MSDMLMGRLGDSLATALIARTQAPRDMRSEGGFGAHLDAARDSIRENRESRELSNGKRADSRDSRADEAETTDKPRDERDAPVAETQDAPVDAGMVAMPIVVVSIAGPATPVADVPDQANVERASDAESTQVPASHVDSADVTIAAQSDSDATAQPVVNADKGTVVDIASNSTAKNGAVPQDAIKIDATGGNAAAAPELGLADVNQSADSEVNADLSGRLNKVAPQPKTSAANASSTAIEVNSMLRPLSEQAVATRGADLDSTHVEPKGESMRDVRVGDALERSLHGEPRQKFGNEGSWQRGSNDQAALGFTGSPVIAGTPATSRAGIASSSESIARPMGVSEITGDPAAAAIGKLLVGVSVQSESTQSETESRGGKSNQQSNTPSANPAVSTTTSTGANSSSIVAAPAPVGATFSQILATRLDPASSMESTARVLSANGGSGRHQVTLRLSPVELGELRLDVRMEAGAMSLRVDADNAAAGRLIESRLGELREALSAHGISIERAEVVVRADASANGGFEHRSNSDDALPRQYSQGENAEGSWNFNNGQSSAGDRSGRSDANPWWMRGDASGIDMEPATHAMRHEDPIANAIMQDGSLDLVA